MVLRSIHLLVLVLLLLAGQAAARPAELRLGSSGHHAWQGHMGVIADPAAALTPDRALAAPATETPASGVPNYGYAEGATWVRLAVDNDGTRRDWIWAATAATR